MAYFALSIFLSAFLIFQVQPMIARYILPWFGGTPAVWSTVQMFFQVLLTGGYAYATWLARPGKRGEKLHLVLLGVSVIAMLLLGLAWKSPITPDASWKTAQGSYPVWEIFKLLAVSVVLPYFLLSSNSPLIQAWFYRAFPEKRAYRLYALSNIGSLLGLVTYPVLGEPTL
ncbi:MAG: ferrichrome ABC transporter permease, partial [Chloroflexi bacterium]|nr:ferrichrome ABC transporter permease [Chloroflexota bacterium]